MATIPTLVKAPVFDLRTDEEIVEHNWQIFLKNNPVVALALKNGYSMTDINQASMAYGHEQPDQLNARTEEGFMLNSVIPFILKHQDKRVKVIDDSFKIGAGWKQLWFKFINDECYCFFPEGIWGWNCDKTIKVTNQSLKEVLLRKASTAAMEQEVLNESK